MTEKKYKFESQYKEKLDTYKSLLNLSLTNPTEEHIEKLKEFEVEQEFFVLEKKSFDKFFSVED